MRRIGIYSGTFNPVHSGHISFALQAIKESQLDKIYFMIDRHRANKSDVAHYGHRVAMVKQAIKPYKKLQLLELNDINFSVSKTYPKLKALFVEDQLVFLLGSDVFLSIDKWPGIKPLLKDAELSVGIRFNDDQAVKEQIASLNYAKNIQLIKSYAPKVSSSKIRDALRRSQEAEGILSSVRLYSNRNWLYISLV